MPNYVMSFVSDPGWFAEFVDPREHDVWTLPVLGWCVTNAHQIEVVVLDEDYDATPLGDYLDRCSNAVRLRRLHRRAGTSVRQDENE